jgi:hypothetical protein
MFAVVARLIAVVKELMLPSRIAVVTGRIVIRRNPWEMVNLSFTRKFRSTIHISYLISRFGLAFSIFCSSVVLWLYRSQIRS